MPVPETRMPVPEICPVARRRAVLLGAGAAGLTALLAACGAEQQPGTPAPAGSPTQAPAEPPPGPDLPEGALVSAEEVPVGSGIVVDDILVIQPQKGTFRAYDAVCPHQRILVSPPDSEGVITCTGHLSHFRDSDGSWIDGPAPRGLTKIEVTVADGYVAQT